MNAKNFKNYINLSFLLFFITINFAQGIKYELYLNNTCKDSVYKIESFVLVKNGIDYLSVDNVVTLKDKGDYLLSSVYLNEERIITINKFGIITDTINLSSINKCYEPTSRPNFSGFCCCDGDCDGINVDYYENGNIRVKGNFKKGKAVGKVKYYYENGNIRMIEKYNKKGVLLRRKEYDKYGKRIRR